MLDNMIRDKEAAQKEIQSTLDTLNNKYPGVQFDVFIRTETLDSWGGNKYVSYVVDVKATL
jgi:hypothetical protein